MYQLAITMDMQKLFFLNKTFINLKFYKIMKYMLFLLVIFAMSMFSTSNVLAISDSTYIEVNLSGALTGKYKISGLNYARIQNLELGEKSTIGLFSDPPSKEYPFDIAMILGYLGKGNIEIGEYKAVEVIRDIPDLKIGQKGGFMTIVPTGQNQPQIEYYTTSGSFNVNEIIEDVKLSGVFDLILKNPEGSKTINAEGKFQIYINE